ncbi:hypothetical protein [Nostoc sp.]|uniref:hypothetical protein n=1 Tax=Nostoc sp. TaxID=1180 RepID=UPI002FFC42D2
MTLALTGSSHGEIDPKKATYLGTGRKPESLILLEKTPAAHYRSSGKSLGNPMVEVDTPNGTINLSEGTNKNELWV